MERRRRNKEIKKRDVAPKVYTPRFNRMVFQLSLLGAKDTEIAEAFGVSVSTINLWKEKYPAFHQAMLKGKHKADAKVAHALYKSAIGYEYDDVVVLTDRIKERNARGKIVKEYTQPLIVTIKKKSLPNPVAADKWLKARQPENWGNKLEVSGTITHEHSLDLSGLSTKELQVLKKLGIEEPTDVPIEDVDYEELLNGNFDIDDTTEGEDSEESTE